MIADLDIWRAANLLVKRHGGDAAAVRWTVTILPLEANERSW